MTTDAAQPTRLQRCITCLRPMASRRQFKRLQVAESYGFGQCVRCFRGTQRTPSRTAPGTRRQAGWRMRAACLGVDDPTVFDSIAQHGNQALPVSIERAAVEYCRDCPVRAQCAAEADADQLVGLWGGVYRVWRSGQARGYRSIDLLLTRLAVSS